MNITISLIESFEHLFYYCTVQLHLLLLHAFQVVITPTNIINALTLIFS